MSVTPAAAVTDARTSDCCGAPLYRSPTPTAQVEAFILRRVGEDWTTFEALHEALPSTWPAALLRSLNTLEGEGLITYFNWAAYRDTIGPGPNFTTDAADARPAR